MWENLVTTAGLLATPVLAISYIPQLISLVKSKNADGISLSFWFILDVSLLLLFILALDTFGKTGTMDLAIAQGLNLGLALINTVLVIYYKKKAIERSL